MKRVVAQVKKELTQLSRDKLTLALALVLPVLLLLLLSKATSLSSHLVRAPRATRILALALSLTGATAFVWITWRMASGSPTRL